MCSANGSTPLAIYMLPEPTKSVGGIRRVVEALRTHLPVVDPTIRFVDVESAADICAFHAVDYAETRKPIVSHVHGMYWKEYPWGKFSLAVNKRVMRSAIEADVVISPTEWVSNILRHELWVEPYTIPHGVDMDEWKYSPDADGPVLWNKSRVDVICNPIPMMELASRLRDVSFESTFIDPQANATDYQNVRITGELKYQDAKAQVQRCGIYLATARETFGIGTLEAMASGKPVLGWNWAGQKEIVEHRVNGYLATPGDYEDLYEGYFYVREHYMRLAASARMLVENHYQWRNIVRQYASIYHKAASGSDGTLTDLGGASC